MKLLQEDEHELVIVIAATLLEVGPLKEQIQRLFGVVFTQIQYYFKMFFFHQFQQRLLQMIQCHLVS